MLGAVILCAGCTAAARPSEMAYVPEKPPDFDEPLYRQIGIARVTGGTRTHPAWISEIGNDEFADAVKRTFSGLGLFDEDGRHELEITLREVAHTALGIEMEVITTIQYVLRDSTRNAVVMDETVVATHTATMSDSLYGAMRLQLAKEGSARANIKQFVERLARLDVGSDEVSVRD